MNEVENLVRKEQQLTQSCEVILTFDEQDWKDIKFIPFSPEPDQVLKFPISGDPEKVDSKRCEFPQRQD